MHRRFKKISCIPSLALTMKLSCSCSHPPVSRLPFASPSPPLFQVIAINDCAYRSRLTSRWVLFIDLDEYILVRPTATLAVAQTLEHEHANGHAAATSAAKSATGTATPGSAATSTPPSASLAALLRQNEVRACASTDLNRVQWRHTVIVTMTRWPITQRHDEVLPPVLSTPVPRLAAEQPGEWRSRSTAHGARTHGV